MLPPVHKFEILITPYNNVQPNEIASGQEIPYKTTACWLFKMTNNFGYSVLVRIVLKRHWHLCETIHRIGKNLCLSFQSVILALSLCSKMLFARCAKALALCANPSACCADASELCAKALALRANVSARRSGASACCSGT